MHAQAEGCKASWSQSTDEVFVKVPVDSSIKGKDVHLEVHPSRLALQVAGTSMLEGSLTDAGEIDLDGEWDVVTMLGGKVTSGSMKATFWHA